MLQARLLFGLLLFLGVTSQKNDDDEGRPYEFSFTIDGEQHRYEKKDVSGIIQGEFGFITGDGVYHVTVYATDENGSFKILSMKNIKVSEPLDRGGKPSTAGLARQQPAGNPQLSGRALSIPVSPVAPQPLPLSKPTSRPVYDFTRASTIRTGCSGCGIVTSPKTTFTFQNPAFQNPINNANVIPSVPTQKPFVPSIQTDSKSPQGGTDLNPIKPLQTNVLPPGTKPVTPSSNPAFRNSISNANVIPSVPTEKPFAPSFSKPPQSGTDLNQIKPQQTNFLPPGTRPPVTPSSNEDGLFTSAIISSSPRILTPNQTNPIKTLIPVDVRSSRVLVQSPRPLPLDNEISHRPINPIAEAKVEGGAIKIPGSEPIQIKDKYPNMVDGLPEGITEKDITDILYKFNYTLGFHGHYEKGLRNGTKIGGYFVNGRDGISRVVTYVADENGYRPKVTFINLGLDSEDTPKPDSEKKFGLKNFEFVWYPIKS